MEKFTKHQYSQGGLAAHVFRRCVHLSILIVPWAYYQYGLHVAKLFSMSSDQLIGLCLAIILLAEILRLSMGWTVFGQRAYENYKISALAWGAIGIGLVLLFVHPHFAIPIIAAAALGDPLLGELRLIPLKKIWVIVLGIILISIIWWVASFWWHIPAWLILIMGPITVAAEWPCLKWIDDNGMILLVPLCVIKIVMG